MLIACVRILIINSEADFMNAIKLEYYCSKYQGVEDDHSSIRDSPSILNVLNVTVIIERIFPHVWAYSISCDETRNAGRNRATERWVTTDRQIDGNQ